MRVVIGASVLTLIASGCGITRVSVSGTGTEANKVSSVMGVTDDGRYSLFTSDADNLVAGDTNGVSDLFRHDATTGATVRVDVASNGDQLADGAYSGSFTPDGRYAVFTTAAPLDPTDTNGEGDAYVRDLTANTTTWASQPPAGGFGPGGVTYPAISADGRYVSFFWQGGFFPPSSDLWRRDRTAGTTTLLNDGGYVIGLFASDDAHHYVIVPTCVQGGCFKVPIIVDADGSGAGWPALPFANCLFQDVIGMSANGRYLVWETAGGTPAPCLASGTYLVDRATGFATPLPETGDVLDVSRDGTAILYAADGTTLPGGTDGRRDLYVRDLVRHTDARLNVTSNGQEGDADVPNGVLSDVGHVVGFESTADDLVANDHNGVGDVFVRPIGISPPP